MHIAGILRNKNCHNYAVNGVEDHIHIVCHLNPTVALSDLVKDIKLGTSDLIKRKCLFPHFAGWQEGYGAFTYSFDARANVIGYVLNQEEHHRAKNFLDEYVDELGINGVDFNAKYLP